MPPRKKKPKKPMVQRLRLRAVDLGPRRHPLGRRRATAPMARLPKLRWRDLA
jgi:hypothetical protein